MVVVPAECGEVDESELEGIVEELGLSDGDQDELEWRSLSAVGGPYGDPLSGGGSELEDERVLVGGDVAKTACLVEEREEDGVGGLLVLEVEEGRKECVRGSPAVGCGVIG